MARVTTVQTSWSGGELSPRLNGRIDLQKYKAGARTLENFQVLPHGGIRKRSGSKFVIQQRDTQDVALIPFQRSTEQSYQILFGDEYCWFFRDQGIITETATNITAVTKANPGVVTSTAHGLENGDHVLIQSVAGMVELNNRWFTVANKTTDTFELSGVDTTSYTTYTSGGTVAKIVELTTTYTADEVLNLQTVQSADTLYIVHKDHPLRKIQSTSHVDWTIQDVAITTGPFRTVNGNRDHTITVSFPSASITGATQADPVVLTFSGGHPFIDEQYITITGVSGMTQLNGNTYVVANATATTLELLDVDGTGFGAYTSGGTAVSAPTQFATHIVGQTCTLTAAGGHTPFTSTMVGSIMRLSEDGASSGYMSAPLGDGTVSLDVGDVYTNEGNVYGIGATNSLASWQPVTRVPSHDSGIVRVFAGAAGGNSGGGSVTTGSYFDSYFLHPTYCVVRITGFTSSTVVSAEIVRYHMPASIVERGTSFFEEGAWSDRRGYPRAICFYEQRLFLAGVEADPTVVWSSKTGLYENFTDGPDDDAALIYRVPARSADVIRWLNAGRVLTAGSSFGEYAFASSSQNQALTPSNVKATTQTSYGSSDCIPVQINQAVLYAQRRGNPDNAAKKIREFQYRYDQDAFGSTDMTVFSEHVLGAGGDRMAYQTEPDSLIWVRRTDGALAACTYERLQEVVAWHRHALGGAGAVKTLAVSPGADGDEVWLSVEREIASETVRYIEVFAPGFERGTAKADAKIVDSHLTYSGSSTSTITGLWHLRGEAVKINNNGSVETGTVSSTGTLTLSKATTTAHIGYGYTAVVETEDFEAGAQAGTAQTRHKKIDQLWINVLDSQGGTVGPDADTQKALLYRYPGHPMGTSPPLKDGFVDIDYAGNWERDAVIRLEHDLPLPMHITSMVLELSVIG